MRVREKEIGHDLFTLIQAPPSLLQPLTVPCLFVVTLFVDSFECCVVCLTVRTKETASEAVHQCSSAGLFCGALDVVGRGMMFDGSDAVYSLCEG